MTIGTNIKTRRTELNLSQEDLARLCGWEGRSRISNYERDERDPNYDDIAKIAKALQCSIFDLLPEENGGENDTETTRFKNYGKSVIIKTFPLLKSSEIREWLNNPVITETVRTFDMATDREYPDEVFAFQHIGKSMINLTHPEESVFGDEYVIVDPNTSPTDGRLVLAEFGEKDFRIRQYREDGAYKFLYAFDPEIKSVPVDENINIIGTIIESRRQR